MAPIVAVESHSLGRSFRSAVVLRDVSFAVGPGQVHALIGPNGVGKTTLLRIIAGLTEPSTGSIEVLGESPLLRSVRSQIGWVPSGDRSLYLRLSGYENLLFFARLHGLSKADASERTRLLLREVGVGEAMNLPVGLYSHGMQKRTAIARAFLARPRVLLLDEATHDLDPTGAEEVRRLVRLAAADGACVLWATQRIDELRGFADSVTLLGSERVLFHGSVASFVESADGQLYELRLGLPDEPQSDPSAVLSRFGLASHADAPGHVLLRLNRHAVFGEAVGALMAAGYQVLGCREARPEIEEAFLSHTGGASIGS